MKPAMEAAYPAFCSWRKEITRSPARCSLRVRSVIGMPGSPKIVSMPFSLRASMTSAKPSVSCAWVLISPLAVFVASSAVADGLAADLGLASNMALSVDNDGMCDERADRRGERTQVSGPQVPRTDSALAVPTARESRWASDSKAQDKPLFNKVCDISRGVNDDFSDARNGAPRHICWA
jgi:hypothetical protein